jgi:hypothetical protein
MDVWFQCEIPYPFVPQEVLDRADSVRASLPSKYCDPVIAANLFAECLDEFLLCDELGINVVAIEHHAGSIRQPPIRSWLESWRANPQSADLDLGMIMRPDRCERRRICNRRCHLTRALGNRLRQIWRQRDGIQQRQRGR